MTPDERELAAAVLAMAAAVGVCLKHGVDPLDVLETVTREVFTPGGFAYRPPAGGSPDSI